MGSSHCPMFFSKKKHENTKAVILGPTAAREFHVGEIIPPVVEMAPFCWLRPASYSFA